MSLAKKIEELLKDELKPENIKTVVDLAEFLRFKEKQNLWDKINESENEYITEDEIKRIEKIRLDGEFIDQDNVIKELGIDEDEI